MYDFFLKYQFKPSKVYQKPEITKVIVRANLSNQENLPTVAAALFLITGEYPRVTYAKKGIASFHLRQGDPLGLQVTLRSKAKDSFLKTLVSLVLPKINDFKGFDPLSLDDRGNLHFGVNTFLLWPQCDPFYEVFHRAGGFHISIIVSSMSKQEAFGFLTSYRLPFNGQLEN